MFSFGALSTSCELLMEQIKGLNSSPCLKSSELHIKTVLWCENVRGKICTFDSKLPRIFRWMIQIFIVWRFDPISFSQLFVQVGLKESHHQMSTFFL